MKFSDPNLITAGIAYKSLWQQATGSLNASREKLGFREVVFTFDFLKRDLFKYARGSQSRRPVRGELMCVHLSWFVIFSLPVSVGLFVFSLFVAAEARRLQSETIKMVLDQVWLFTRGEASPEEVASRAGGDDADRAAERLARD